VRYGIEPGGARQCPARDDFSLPGQSSVTAAWPLMAGYGLGPIRPAHSTLLNRAGGTWSAWEKSKPAVTLVQYAALCFGLMFGPAANFTPPCACAGFSVVVCRMVEATAV
jgi:hypothetical protein